MHHQRETSGEQFRWFPSLTLMRTGGESFRFTQNSGCKKFLRRTPVISVISSPPSSSSVQSERFGRKWLKAEFRNELAYWRNVVGVFCPCEPPLAGGAVVIYAHLYEVLGWPVRAPAVSCTYRMSVNARVRQKKAATKQMIKSELYQLMNYQCFLG